MKNTTPLILAMLVLLVGLPQSHAQPTAFTYNGHLLDGGGPAMGIYDLRFTIYDALEAGNAASGALTNTGVAVSNGLFTATLDFGANPFSGADRWLEIGVRADADGVALAAIQGLNQKMEERIPRTLCAPWSLEPLPLVWSPGFSRLDALPPEGGTPSQSRFLGREQRIRDLERTVSELKELMRELAATKEQAR